MKLGLWVIALGLGVLLLGAIVAGFNPQPSQRVIFDGTRYQVIEDYDTGLLCTIDKQGQKPPDCKPIPTNSKIVASDK